MACPVLLAVVLNKVDVKSKGNGLARRISPIAASSLWLCLLPFLFLNMSAVLAGLLERFSDGLFRVSKVLVHFCAIVQMILAYLILLLITMEAKLFFVFLVPFIMFILWRCYWCSQNDKDHDQRVYNRNCHIKLEDSLDFSATVTAMLFLALEGMALEGQASIGQQVGLNSRSATALYLGFATCVMAAVIMLLGAIPPLIEDDDRQRTNMCSFFDALCLVLAAFVTLVVFTIVVMALPEEVAATVVAVPWLVMLLVYAIYWCRHELNPQNPPQPNQTETQPDSDTKPNQTVLDANVGVGELDKPASLELTKITFTGFLAVSITSLGNGSGYPVRGHTTDAFIVLTAAAVIWGLLWRLLTHRNNLPKLPVDASAKIACFFTHLFVAAAVIPFVLMAQKTLLASPGT